MVGIKDFEMPSCCGECQMASCKGLSGQFYCDITTYDVDMDNTERDVDCPLVEATPKDQYKADMIEELEDLKKEIIELPFPQREPEYMQGYSYCQMNILDYVIQEKIDNLKEKKK